LTSVLPVDRSFRAYLSRGQNAVKEGVIDSKRLVGNTSEIRNAQSTTTSAGGYLVPQSFADRFESMLVAYDRLFDVATLFQTTTGSATGYPILEDTANAAAVVAENITSAAGPDLVFATLAFDKTPTWRSGMIRAAVELVNDSAFNFEQLLAGAGAARMARGIGATFVSTLLSSATLGKTAAATTAITGDELFDLVDSVDPAYQANGSWLMARPTFTSLLKLKASTGGTYLFESAIDSAGRPTLLGFPVYLCPSMPAATAGLKAISFGDHSKFIRREVKGSLAVKTYVERYAELGQVGYEVFYRCDGGLLKSASNSPVKYLQMHA
ncbi:MAG TPA: phage major capsid protein, partial [Candidatus Sulfotelmatobacter sp.]|nr:phage major capsid protein [Candidatus Sulfotelmatobacter sp.]